MTAPLKFRKRPVEITAVRYGDTDTGAWSDHAVKDVAAFMTGIPAANLTDSDILSVVQPTGAWAPPENAALQLYDDIAHKEWLPLALGDWVICGVNGEFYPCKPDIFVTSYEPVVDENPPPPDALPDLRDCWGGRWVWDADEHLYFADDGPDAGQRLTRSQIDHEHGPVEEIPAR